MPGIPTLAVEDGHIFDEDTCLTCRYFGWMGDLGFAWNTDEENAC